MRGGLVALGLFILSSGAIAVPTDDYRARIERAWSLGKEGGDAVPELLRLLRDDEPVVRTTAVASLGRIGPEAEAAVPVLLAALSDPTLRCAAARSLARIAPDRAEVATAILPLLGSPSDIVREEAVRALARMGRAAIPGLLALRATADAKRIARDAIPELRREAAGEDRWNAVWASCSLVLVTGEVAPHLAAIRKALSDERAWGAAVQAIVRLGSQAAAALPDLLAMLDDEDRNRRYQAVVAIGGMGRAGLPARDELVRRDRRGLEKDPYVRQAIRTAIEKLASAR